MSGKYMTVGGIKNMIKDHSDEDEVMLVNADGGEQGDFGDVFSNIFGGGDRTLDVAHTKKMNQFASDLIKFHDDKHEGLAHDAEQIRNALKRMFDGADKFKHNQFTLNAQLDRCVTAANELMKVMKQAKCSAEIWLDRGKEKGEEKKSADTAEGQDAG